ncbi:uncharacterized protein [Diadema antillarum]
MQQLLKEIMALPFLPANQIPPAFQQLQQRNNTARLNEVYEYIQDTWLDGSYPAASWSVYGRAVRTNNDVEGWHHRLNGRAAGKALGVYALMALLKREADLVDMTRRLISLQKLTKRQRRAATTAQGRLFRHWDDFDQGNVTASQLLRRCSHLYGAAPRGTV